MPSDATPGRFFIESAGPSESRVERVRADVPQRDHYGGVPSGVPPGFLSSVTYLSFRFGVRSGRATGGTIEVDDRTSMSIYEVDVRIAGS